jgi:phosphopantothenoylcysteine decarboxylase/phosphopantothenate--cysteine ligase
MGYELAGEAKKRGYRVTLISGPSPLKPPAGVRFLSIETARQLHEKVQRELKNADILVMASAVSDFRPAAFSKKKIKSRRRWALGLVRNPDILKAITRKARRNKIIVGFSLETNNLLRNSLRKLRDKKLDLIVANKCGRRNVPFGKGPSTVYLLKRPGQAKTLRKATKKRIAGAILDTIKELCYTPN